MLFKHIFLFLQSIVIFIGYRKQSKCSDWNSTKSNCFSITIKVQDLGSQPEVKIPALFEIKVEISHPNGKTNVFIKKRKKYDGWTVLQLENTAWIIKWMCHYRDISFYSILLFFLIINEYLCNNKKSCRSTVLLYQS